MIDAFESSKEASETIVLLVVLEILRGEAFEIREGPFQTVLEYLKISSRAF